MEGKIEISAFYLNKKNELFGLKIKALLIHLFQHLFILLFLSQKII